ncbi:MAG: methyl-accepting chemotaxis protein [Beijerinckiaceae bacterium]
MFQIVRQLIGGQTMFPHRFQATVGQRMAIWAALLGFLALLYVTSEVINDLRLSGFSAGLQELSDAAVKAPGDPANAEKLAAMRGRIDYHLANASRNKLLIALLLLFVFVQIMVLEYRWLVRPVIAMSVALRGAGQDRTPDGTARNILDQSALRSIAMRRDEIGMLARALVQHGRAVQESQDTSTLEVARIGGELERQAAFKRETVAFQERISRIAQALETQAGQMSRASSEMATLSTSVDTHAGEAAASTKIASANVDTVARSISEIAAILMTTTREAQHTSRVAVEAKSLVTAANDDARVLAEAVSAIEQVVGLIEDVASKTNLLALNATIEAARVGEAGRGFAVVASEVKQLASRTADATGDVRAKLQAITAAAGMIAARVGDLVGSVDDVERAAGTIAGLMQRQDETSNAITASTSQTASVVRNVADKVQHVAGMVEEARSASDIVANASAELGVHAADLRALIEEFSTQTARMAA